MIAWLKRLFARRCPVCKGRGVGEHIKRIDYIGGTWGDLYRICVPCRGTSRRAGE